MHNVQRSALTLVLKEAELIDVKYNTLKYM